MRSMTLGVDHASLSVIDQTTIGNGGVLALDFGKVVSRQITIEAGGSLIGEGRLAGQVAIESGGQISPGDPLGSGGILGDIEIEGGLRLHTGSLTAVDLEDNISVEGQIELGGTLLLNATNVQIGRTEMFLTGDNIVGEFDDIQIIRPANGYVALSFSSTAIGGTPWPPGDYSQNEVVDMEDLGRFVLGLLNAEAYEKTYNALPTAPGDMNNDGLLDFDDVPLFAEALTRGSLADVLAAIEAAQRQFVPEPATCVPAMVFIVGLGVLWRKARLVPHAWSSPSIISEGFRHGSVAR
jgi:hypothetical protein